jgi:outer membrane protein assembly factor BamB
VREGRRPRAIWATLAVLTLAGSGGAITARADLTTFGYGNQRLGSTAAAVGITPRSASRLRVAWRTNVGGAVSGQPLVVDLVRIGKRLHNLVLVGTEEGQVVALDARSGAVLWRHRVSRRKIVPDCDASPNGVFGITATMVADPRSGLVYAVDVDGLAWALELASGAVAPGWPVRVHAQGADFVWGGLTLSRGRLYVTVASLCDQGHYYGGIDAVNVAHPQRIVRWRTTAGTRAYGGGIWGWGGVSIDGRGDVYAASGNSIGTASEAAGAAESVIELSPQLVVQQQNHPLHPPFKIFDRDFGTTPVLVHAPGCPAQLVAINKDGELFLYDRARIAAGPTERIQVAADAPNSIPLYGMPAYDPATRTLVLVSPTTPAESSLRGGLQAFRLADTCRLVSVWQHAFDPPNAGSAPTIAGGVVYIGSGRDGRLLAFRLRDGLPLFDRSLSSEAVFAAPTVADGQVLIGDWGGHVTALLAPAGAAADEARRPVTAR